jgi:5-methylcytosine-specific restriction protein B
LRISFGDKRVTYNYYNNGLYFTIGKRYSLVYKPNHNEAKFLIICTKSIGITNLDKTFGGEPLAYFCRRNDLDFTKEELDAIQMAMQIELSRTEKSTYQRFSKSNFEQYLFNKNNEKGNLGLVKDFKIDAENQGLIFSPFLIKRYTASLATKPFVIFTGLSGSGKTKLVQTFAKWLCKNESQYKVIPVGADWTNREPLLGYPNSLDDKNYVLPDNGALALIIEASENAKDEKIEDCDPFFLILDEMNLSHVERYFADFLSTMESKDEIKLYSGDIRTASNGMVIPDRIKLPPNLFIVGTVNIDETTYMFSPKVLDRANTIEFRIDEDDIASFFSKSFNENPLPIDGLGITYAQEFMKLVNREHVATSTDSSLLLSFFEELQKLGAEFGYRTANEILRLTQQLDTLGLDAKEQESALDVAVMQKMLPKLHGSRSKLTKVLPVLASFCLKGKDVNQAKLLLDSFKNERKLTKEQTTEVMMPLSFTKIARMYINANENGFASYAEG